LPATPDELRDVVDEIALDGVSNVTVAGQSVSALDPLKVEQIAKMREADDALDGTNANGGSRSGWNQLRPARFSPAGPGQ
jgi:hypothetical protein